MFRIHASTTLPFPPDTVFAAVGGVESALRWQVGVLGVRRARPRPGQPLADRPGGLLRVSYFALGARHALVVHVTSYDPPRRFAYRADGDAFALDVSLEAVPTRDGTRVTYDLGLTSHALPADAPAADRAVAERHAVALRRLLGRRAPRDLARLGVHVARRLGASALHAGARPVDARHESLGAAGPDAEHFSTLPPGA